MSNLRTYAESQLNNHILTSESGYFQIPNSIFNLELSPNEFVVFFNLIRRADRDGECFPGIPRIGKDTGIKSDNTVRKVLRRLMDKKLIRRTGRTYRNVQILMITPSIYESIKISNEQYRSRKCMQSKNYMNPSIIEVVTPSNYDLRTHQHMSTKEEKNEYPFFKENKKRYSANTHKKNSYRKKCRISNYFPLTMTRSVLDIPHSHAKRILGEFGIKENNQQEKALDDSNLDPKKTKDAIDELERIRTMNLLEHPKVYENNLDPFDI